MNKAGIEKALRNSVKSAPTIPFEELATMPYVKLSEHDYITKQTENRKLVRMKKLALVFACCLILVASVSGWFVNYRTPDSIITIDVNPSIEIRTNSKNQILSIKALNDDAKAVLKDYDYKGSGLAKTVAVLMQTLVQHDYLNSDKNTILLTVMNKNNTKADTLMTKAASAIEESLKTQNITPTIMKQVISQEEGRNKLAKQYNISEGRLSLIQGMIAINGSLTMDMLADKTIQQLLDLAKENSMDLSKYVSISGGKISSDADKEETSKDNDKEETSKGNDKSKVKDYDTKDSKVGSDMEDNEDGLKTGDDNLSDESHRHKENRDQNQYSNDSENQKVDSNEAQGNEDQGNVTQKDSNEDGQNEDSYVKEGQTEDSYQVSGDKEGDNRSEDGYHSGEKDDENAQGED